jgi:hypothetical protein
MFFRLMKVSVCLRGGFPISTEFFFSLFIAPRFLKTLFFPNNYDPVFIDSNPDFCYFETLNVLILKV